MACSADDDYDDGGDVVGGSGVGGGASGVRELLVVSGCGNSIICSSVGKGTRALSRTSSEQKQLVATHAHTQIYMELLLSSLGFSCHRIGQADKVNI